MLENLPSSYAELGLLPLQIAYYEDAALIGEVPGTPSFNDFRKRSCGLLFMNPALVKSRGAGSRYK